MPSGIAGNFGQTNYAASKAALLGYCRDREASDRSRSSDDSGGDPGPAWNCVAPGFIDTAMTRGLPLAQRVAVTRILTPLGHPGTPEDVAAAVAFLASQASARLNGGCLRVCGGLAIGR